MAVSYKNGLSQNEIKEITNGSNSYHRKVVQMKDGRYFALSNTKYLKRDTDSLKNKAYIEIVKAIHGNATYAVNINNGMAYEII